MESKGEQFQVKRLKLNVPLIWFIGWPIKQLNNHVARGFLDAKFFISGPVIYCKPSLETR
jgi:hypothetical protein